MLPVQEVAVFGNIEAFKRLNQQIPIPMATGEREHTFGSSAVSRTSKQSTASEPRRSLRESSDITRLQRHVWGFGRIVPFAPNKPELWRVSLR